MESAQGEDNALAIIEKSGILNPSAQLKDVLELSRKMAPLQPTLTKGPGVTTELRQFFIHNNFCLTHIE